jgi:hypothetical protein
MTAVTTQLQRPIMIATLRLPILAITVLAFAAAVGGRAEAQDRRPHDHGHHSGEMDAAMPTAPGQQAFAAIQEVVAILEADPTTDWSKVNIAALREHLIDMDEVTMRAVASERALGDGLEISVTGQGRAREAIKRMVPAHFRELAASGWRATTTLLPDGARIVVTAADPAQAVRLKALGFMGLMVQGGHHQPHHLMIAKGEFAH